MDDQIGFRLQDRRWRDAEAARIGKYPRTVRVLIAIGGGLLAWGLVFAVLG